MLNCQPSTYQYSDRFYYHLYLLCIRIEDEVRATTGAPENLTRDAFAVA